jgi:hypothetical protein
MLTVFWDSLGVLLAHFQKRGENRTVKDAIRKKFPGHLAKGVILQNDNARPHTPKQPRREFENDNGNVLDICPTSRTWPLVTSDCLVGYETTLVANVLC